MTVAKTDNFAQHAPVAPRDNVASSADGKMTFDPRNFNQKSLNGRHPPENFKGGKSFNFSLDSAGFCDHMGLSGMRLQLTSWIIKKNILNAKEILMLIMFTFY